MTGSSYIPKDRLRLLFCDHLNLARGKYLPSTAIRDGESRFCQSTFGVTYDKDLLPSPGSKMMEGLPDMQAVYKAEDIRDSWEEHTKVVVADLLESDGSPFELCGRGLLKRTIVEWQSKGFTPKIGLELEAFAFQCNSDGELVPYDTPGAYVYSTGILSDPAGFNDAIWQKGEELGFEFDCITSEFDSPQFEYTLKYDDAVKAVDDSFLFRLMAREIALQHGIVLTFLPKPIPEKGGNGLHVNFSLLDNNGQNAIGEAGGIDGLTELARGCVAGLMHHHAGMAALVAPTVNSYERLQPAALSGYWQNWGGDHRGVTTRVSSEGGAKARIEHRMADGCANPYTAVATVLQAAKLGVDNQYSLPPAETGDCFEKTDAKSGAPKDLGAALQALKTDKALQAAVGEELCANLIFMKQDEIEKVMDMEAEAQRDFYIHYI